jgi:hypothetical protein
MRHQLTYWEILSVIWGAWELQLAAAQQLPVAYLDLFASPLRVVR